MVEDNPGDIELTQEALADAKIANELTVVYDGVEAMAYLAGEGKYAGRTLPDLILLDLNLPRKDGRETLAEIKASPLLRRIPVVVLTSSKAEADILTSYNLHANSYIAKPVDFEQFLEIIEAIEGFWLSLVRLPVK